MYLEKLEIQGFKSFANKNVLVFPGKVAGHSGMTAIVGPNGSGKSNVADAVRWALGEQSMKMLRGKKSEDIIFSGSDKKGKLGMAEVALYLNNADHQAALDYEQVVITRRLYRDGESEYLLNGSRVRLFDIQMLLAKANFGQKTYSVIGQGMVENFLNTSLSERKEFFDEATGVKQYQIKRDDSLNKLKLSLENLGQSQMLLGEIEPHLKALTRQVSRFAKKEELEAELKTLSLEFYGRLWQELNNKLLKVNQSFLQIEKTKREKESRLRSLEKDLASLERQNSVGGDFASQQAKLAALQADKDKLTAQIAKLDAYAEMKLEAAGKFDLSFLNNRQRDLTGQSETLAEELKAVAVKLAHDQTNLDKLHASKQTLVEKINAVNLKIKTLSHEAPTEDKEIKQRLSGLISKLTRAQEHDDLAQVKKIIAEIKEELQELVSGVKEDERRHLGAWQQELVALAEDKDHLLEEVNQLSGGIRVQQERQKMLKQQQAAIEWEMKDIKQKLAGDRQAADPKAQQGERAAAQIKLAEINKQIAAAREQFGELQKTQESKRADLFAWQKNLHQLQTDINALAGQLNDYKIEAARHETKLEDLENEIRDNGAVLAEIKTFKAKGEIDSEATHERLRQLRRQLDAIGTIDPEVEKEYAATKERYDFLSTQVNDLTGTIESLEQVIAELDGIIKTRFDKEFKVIETKFSEYFKILFSGGNAKIIKVVAEDLEESAEENEAAELSFKDKVMKKLKALSRHDSVGLAGVDIMATPPGKKIQSVAMLSGGERALTAIALICAIISANPSPFVVLDEVDAALDEANSERLAKILDDLSHKTQFIAITHNRAMMRRAAILYGITMGDDSVSKLLSVKLEEADKNL